MVQNEKRRSLRRKVHIPIMSWEEVDGQRSGPGLEIISRDLSGEGLAFFSKSIYPINTNFFTDIFLPNHKKPISCRLKVVRVEALPQKDEYLIGGIFFNIAAQDREDISTSLGKMDLYVLLKSAITGGASDLHLTVGRPPMVRRNGRILTMAGEIIEPGQVEAMLYPLLTRKQIQLFEERKEMDFAFSPDMNSRFRVNMHSQKGYVEAVLRNVPPKIKSFKELNLPEETMKNFCLEKSGLILIAGTTGSGKTTTMMSMVDHINQTKEGVVVTIEDPIEHTLKSQKSIIKQRELGSDTYSYTEALRRVLRQDPDVICVGELLDGDCLLAAMRAAETGHLVISTVHAPDTVSAVERSVNFFPPEHSLSMRQQLSSCLVGVVFQILVPNKQQGGNTIATEVLINNTAMKHLIKEGRYNLMENVLQTGRSQGMYKLKDNLTALAEQGIIDEEIIEQLTKDK
ncbi:MAG: PilT/PilU family type 4a pilus ATPase [Candidatus Omnitrophica bacterium]|nr:PilT/PilU family type 4a pilus ATPase [Candidatus Omnitrophota bacterium]